MTKKIKAVIVEEEPQTAQEAPAARTEPEAGDAGVCACGASCNGERGAPRNDAEEIGVLAEALPFDTETALKTAPAETDAALKIMTAPQTRAEAIPVFLREDFDEMADRFFAAYPDAQKFKREIAEILCGEDVPQHAPFEDAYIKAVTRRLRDPAEMLSDDEFIEKYILTDSYILRKFKAALARELRDANAPATITGGGAQIITPINRPKNLKEAAQMTEKYFDR